MIRAPHSLISLFRRFARETRAAAAVEFALVLPIMLLLYVGSIEASALISMDRRIQTISGSIGDLVARADGEITRENLNDYFRAAENILIPNDTAGLVQRVTMIEIEDGTPEVIWSRQFLGGSGSSTTGLDKGSTYPLPDEITDIARKGYVVAAEVRYGYTPVLGMVFDQVYQLYRENFFIPRFEGKICYDEPSC